MYLDLITLEDAKIHLGVDDTSRDREIARMIRMSLKYVEKHSNHILVPRDQAYLYRDGTVRIYDYPINSVVIPSPDTTTQYEFTTYSTYVDSNPENVGLTLNVGYTDPEDIPEELIEAAYMVLEHLYNQKETGDNQMPGAVVQLIRSVARFTI